jgi:alpha-amylase
MTEWALPESQHQLYLSVLADVQTHPRRDDLTQFLRAGSWRNFKVRYPETAEMYFRMLEISNRIERLNQTNALANDQPWLEARDALFRGQCNCAYWHGAFGGVYLPHLRNGVFFSLIEADNLLTNMELGTGNFAECLQADFNADQQDEVRLANAKMILYLAPSQGGALYEWDIRAQRINLVSTLSRRPEVYHERLRKHARGESEVAGIHPGIAVRSEGLDQHLIFDHYLRKSLIDHFWERRPTLAEWTTGMIPEMGDFANGLYDAHVGPTFVKMERLGTAGHTSVRVTKQIEISADHPDMVVVHYRIERNDCGSELHFGVEFHWAAMAGGPPDRYYCDPKTQDRLGTLGESLTHDTEAGIALVDEWLNIKAEMTTDGRCHILAFPLRTVSQCESGYELIHQSACVTPIWTIPAGTKTWETALGITVTNHRADEGTPPVACAVG